jgi:hypothetical protein
MRKAVLHRRNDIRGTKEARRRESGTHLNEMHARHAVCERKGNEDALYYSAEFSVVDGLPCYIFAHALVFDAQVDPRDTIP